MLSRQYILFSEQNCAFLDRSCATTSTYNRLKVCIIINRKITKDFSLTCANVYTSHNSITRTLLKAYHNIIISMDKSEVAVMTLCDSIDHTTLQSIRFIDTRSD